MIILWIKTIYVEHVENEDITKKQSNKIGHEDDILIFLTVYEIPPYDYVKAFLEISKKKYEIIYYILWALIYQRKRGFDVKNNH